MDDGRTRCPWAAREPERTYHDTEWGVPVHDDVRLFECLVLESAQAGLSWSTILRKREGYRRVFAGFDPRAVAAFDEAAIDAAVADPGIVRHRGKIVATVANAVAFREIQRAHGSFDAFLWAFVDGRPVVSRYDSDDGARATTALSDTIGAALRARGFRFVGSTTIHAYLQAVGVRDDHRATCFRAVTATDRVA